MPAVSHVDVLLFGAHPDDVEWGAGGTALLLRNSGTSFAIVDMTNGEMGSRGTLEQRQQEAIAAAEFLGASAREPLNLPDCGLIDSPENRKRIASVIRRHRPKLVIAPFWEDRHPDHAAAGLTVRKSQLYCGLTKLDDPNPPHKPDAFLFYPLHQFEKPSFVVDTTSVFQRKLELMRIHRSQFEKTAEEFGVIAHGVGDYLFGLESRDRYFGSLVGARYGEAFVSERPIRLSSVGDVLLLLGG
ncbi:MAG TPA: bacillithiol biosynthesis deacetylase BshB1 [Bryobacteraceae bacterium]|jgi:bacillithiol biosynthesis deacetylase BshB1|nr:bacillithiol biosynthesis deacetylase BshB1 [Bryobacteraceae bacterium]